MDGLESVAWSHWKGSKMNGDKNKRKEMWRSQKAKQKTAIPVWFRVYYKLLYKYTYTVQL